jgi:polyhydroxyalkanoate synthesis regulator phasin
MAEVSNDPFAVWQRMIAEMEKGFNAFANQAMATSQFSKAMNQAGGATAGAQKQISDLMERYLVRMNMPSRAQMVGMAERLQAIESQLNDIQALLQQMNANAAPQPVTTSPPQPVMEAQLNDIKTLLLQMNANAAPRPVTNAAPQPVTNSPPRPVAAVEPKPVTGSAPKPPRTKRPPPAGETK